MTNIKKQIDKLIGDNSAQPQFIQEQMQEVLNIKPVIFKTDPKFKEQKESAQQVTTEED